MIEPWYVYIVECSDNTLYTGIAKDVTKRVAQHNAGKGAKYTRGRCPVQLLFVEKHNCQSSAMMREIEIKKLNLDAKKSLCQR